MKHYIISSIITFFVFFGFQISSYAELEQFNINKIHVLNVEEAITPATFNYLKSGFEKVKNEKNTAILIKINTPGGLVSVTQDIMHLIANGQNLIIGWIGPSSASATSAGAIISSCIPALYMADGTRIGAATPISGSSDIKEGDLKNKIINDLVSLVKSQAESTGKNPKVFIEMITEAKSLTANEALKAKVHNGIVDTIEGEGGLLAKINGAIIQKHHKKFKVTIAKNYTMTEQVKTLGQNVLTFFASPDMAYILFLIGAALIYLEFQAPGGFIAGSIGAVCILIAGISFGVLSLNVGALLLIIAAFILFILEIYITSFGLLTIAGIASLVFGSLFLFQTQESYLEISLPVLISSIGGILAFIAIIAYVFYKSRKKIFSGPYDPYSGKVTTITSIDSGNFYAKYNGELWQLSADSDMSKLAVGDKVTIIEKDNVKLKVKF